MLDHPPLVETLALIHADLGEPPLVPLDPRDGPRPLRAAFTDAARSDDGALLALLARGPAEAALVRTWLPLTHGVDYQVVPVREGELVLVYVPGRAVAPATTPAVARQPTPDLLPVPDATADDLDDGLIRRVLVQAGRADARSLPATATNEERFLALHGVLAHDGVSWRPTVAAMVALGRRPELFLPGCAVIGAVDGQAIDVRGPLPRQLRTLDRTVDTIVDRAVLLEAVLNALLHRDWDDATTPARVAVDGERVDVVQPGRLAGGAPARPCHRNPKLVEFAVALGLTRGDGTGLADVTRRLTQARRSPPSLVGRDGAVRFVAEVPRARRATAPTPRHLPPVPAARVESAHRVVPLTMPATVPAPTAPTARVAPPSQPAPVPPPIALQHVFPALLPRDPDDRTTAVLAALRARGRASTREIAATLGCSRPVIGKVLTALVSEGRVRPTEADGHSPFQAYEVVAAV